MFFTCEDESQVDCFLSWRGLGRVFILKPIGDSIVSINPIHGNLPMPIGLY